MNFTNNIRRYFKNIGLQGKTTASEEVCPNCWGRQEYEGLFYKPLKTQNFKDEIQKKGWVVSYVEQHLKNIRLTTKSNKLTCNICYVRVN